MLQKRLTTTRPRGPGADEVVRLIRNLDSDEYPVREKAKADLEKAGPCVLTALRKTLESPPSLEVRKRVERLLVRLDPTELPAEELIAVRGVQTLEYMGTPEARRLLEHLSREADGRLNEEAAQAMERLGRVGTAMR
jgi:HEAT repeat protein